MNVISGINVTEPLRYVEVLVLVQGSELLGLVDCNDRDSVTEIAFDSVDSSGSCIHGGLDCVW